MSAPHSSEASAPVAFDGSIVFLVYDSRSGSTFFSSELAKVYPQMVVSPEFRINALLNLDEEKLHAMSGQELVKVIAHARGLANLELNEQELAAALENSAAVRTHEQVLRTILGFYVHTQGRTDAKAFLIKKGTHLQAWRRITQCLTGVKFVHIFRDPRAVINSKLSTRRPYYPLERMAWGGALVSALQWKEYSHQMQLAANDVPVYDVRYENFLQDSQKVLNAIEPFLGVTYESEGGGNYAIPEAEKGIHTLVKTGADNSRAAAWKTEMKSADVLLVEQFAGAQMRQRGYTDKSEFAALTRILVTIKGVFESTARMLFHYPYVWWTNRQGKWD